MLFSRSNLRRACLSVALMSLLAACGSEDSTENKPKLVGLQAEAYQKAKTASKEERQAVLLNAKWAKETEAYSALLKKAAQSGDKLSDDETLKLGSELYAAHVALEKVGGRDHTQIMYLLRADAIGSKAEQVEMGKFSSKLRTLRNAKGLGSHADEARRLQQRERIEARHAQAKAAEAAAKRGQAPSPAATSTQAGQPAASAATSPIAPSVKP